MKIRKGTFETNSSSTHSIAISKNKINIPTGSYINFRIGEYGWEENEYNFPSYMYTSLLYNNDIEVKGCAMALRLVILHRQPRGHFIIISS